MEFYNTFLRDLRVASDQDYSASFLKALLSLSTLKHIEVGLRFIHFLKSSVLGQKQREKRAFSNISVVLWMYCSTCGSATSETLSLFLCISFTHTSLHSNCMCISPSPSTFCESLSVLPLGPWPDASFHFPQ